MSNPEADCYYSRVGAKQSADQAEIEALSREAVREYHPDQNEHPESQSQFRRVMAAKDCLTDTEARRAYDRLRKKCEPEEATAAYCRWDDGGRFRSPTQYISTGAGEKTSKDSRNRKQRAEQSRTKRKSTKTTQTSQAGPNSQNKRTGSQTNTSSTTEQNGPSETGRSSHKEHKNFDHRQSYERKTYDPPQSGKISQWLRAEAALFTSELTSFVALFITAGIGLVATTVLGFVMVIGIAVLGPGFAIAGVESPHIFSERLLTGLLELGVYMGVFLVTMFMFPLLYHREWDRHLGNTMVIPNMTIIAPSLILIGVLLSIPESNLQEALLTNTLKLESALLLFGALWPFLHRSVRLLSETAPNHTGESYLDSLGWVVFQIGAGCFLLGLYLLQGQYILGSLDVALEYTVLLQHLPPTTLLLATGGVAFGTVILTVLTSLSAIIWNR